MEEKRKNVDSIIKWMGDVANLVTNHGAWKLLSSTMVLCVCIFMVTVTLNPGFILDKIEDYTTKEHEERRMIPLFNQRWKMQCIIWEQVEFP